MYSIFMYFVTRVISKNSMLPFADNVHVCPRIHKLCPSYITFLANQLVHLHLFPVTDR